METTIMENQMEKKMENEMETGIIRYFIMRCKEISMMSTSSCSPSTEEAPKTPRWGRLSGGPTTSRTMKPSLGGAFFCGACLLTQLITTKFKPHNPLTLPIYPCIGCSRVLPCEERPIMRSLYLSHRCSTSMLTIEVRM